MAVKVVVKVCVSTHEYLNGEKKKEKKKFGQGALLKSHKNTVRIGLLLTVQAAKCLELLVRYYDGEQCTQALE